MTDSLLYSKVYSSNSRYFKMDLSVSPQVTFVRERANDLLGEEIIQAIKDKYVNKDGRMDADNQRKAARLFLLILKGAEVDVNGYKMKPLDLPKRIEFYTSCVVYSSRCERFHGDYYSPLKSSLTDMGTYYEYYYLMTFSYALWGIMMNKTQSVVGGQDAFTTDAVCNSITESLNRVNILPNK